MIDLEKLKAVAKQAEEFPTPDEREQAERRWADIIPLTAEAAEELKMTMLVACTANLGNHYGLQALKYYEAAITTLRSERDAARAEVAQKFGWYNTAYAALCAMERERDALLAKVSEEGLRPVVAGITDEIAERLNETSGKFRADALILKRLNAHFSDGRKE